MMLINNDLKLVTMDEEYVKLWLIDFNNFEITEINKIRLS